MTNYPLVKQADIIRYPHAFSFPIAKTRSVSAIKKTENRSNLYLFGFADYDTLPSVFGTPVDAGHKRAACSQPLYACLCSDMYVLFFRHYHPIPEKFGYRAIKAVCAYAALCTSAVFQAMPVSKTVQ